MAAIAVGDVIAHTIMSVIVAAAVNPSQETLKTQSQVSTKLKWLAN